MKPTLPYVVIIAALCAFGMAGSAPVKVKIEAFWSWDSSTPSPMASFALTNVADNAQMSIAYASNTTQKLPNSADIRIDAPSGLFGFDAVMYSHIPSPKSSALKNTVRTTGSLAQNFAHIDFSFTGTQLEGRLAENQVPYGMRCNWDKFGFAPDSQGELIECWVREHPANRLQLAITVGV